MMGGRPLDIDVLIIDEAQDLSTAQWRYVSETFCNAKRVYIGGDDDQAIFEWSGADVNHFINLNGTKTVLDKSYRIPKSIHTLAENISGKIKTRNDKKYTSRQEEGSIEYWMNVDDINMSSGTWLLLARNSYLLGELAAVAKQQGYNYTLKNKNAVSKTLVKAIQLWEKHRKGLILSDNEKEQIKLYVDVWDTSKIWHEAFGKMPAEEREFYVSMLRRGESLTNEPRIKISTIHGSKGGEADNVVLLTDMAYNTWEATNLNQDSEYRVWYVGVTRAKQNLNIIMPRGRYHFEL